MLKIEASKVTVVYICLVLLSIFTFIPSVQAPGTSKHGGDLVSTWYILSISWDPPKKRGLTLYSRVLLDLQTTCFEIPFLRQWEIVLKHFCVNWTDVEFFCQRLRTCEKKIRETAQWLNNPVACNSKFHNFWGEHSKYSKPSLRQLAPESWISNPGKREMISVDLNKFHAYNLHIIGSTGIISLTPNFQKTCWPFWVGRDSPTTKTTAVRLNRSLVTPSRFAPSHETLPCNSQSWFETSASQELRGFSEKIGRQFPPFHIFHWIRLSAAQTGWQPTWAPLSRKMISPRQKLQPNARRKQHQGDATNHKSSACKRTTNHRTWKQNWRHCHSLSPYLGSQNNYSTYRHSPSWRSTQNSLYLNINQDGL